MHLQSFFTKQRYIILFAGLASFAAFLMLANIFGYDSEVGVLFVDLSGSAITIMATALAIEYFQYTEELDRTHEVANLAEEEIQAICYRVRLTVAELYGFRVDTAPHEHMRSLKDIDAYLKDTTKRMDAFYDDLNNDTTKIISLDNYQQASTKLEREIENTVELFGYTLPHTLRASVMLMRSNLQISERAVAFINDAHGINAHNRQLIHQVTSTVYDSARNVLRHESRTDNTQQIATKPSRTSN